MAQNDPKDRTLHIGDGAYVRNEGYGCVFLANGYTKERGATDAVFIHDWRFFERMLTFLGGQNEYARKIIIKIGKKLEADHGKS